MLKQLHILNWTMSKISNNEYDQVVVLIHKGDKERACRVFLHLAEKDMVNFLNRRYGWERDEALNLVHQCYLLVEKKILAQEVESFSRAYVRNICEKLAANQYRKIMRERENCSKYIEETKQMYRQEMKSYIGIDLYADNRSVNYAKILGGFRKLGFNCQEIIKLKYMEGYSHSQIVEQVYSIKTEAISRTNLKRCMQKLRKLIFNH